MSQDKPAHQRPELPDFWDRRFADGIVPWDAGRAPEKLQSFARGVDAEGGGRRQRVLIPGCGSAHDALFLSRLGWQVVALDFSAAALETARGILGDWSGELRHEDFFRHRPAAAYTVIYERAFLCALPRKLWPDYGKTMAALLVPGGVLAGYFLFGDELKGPPFPIRREQLDALLEPYFELIEETAVSDSIDIFHGRERWLAWRRRADGGPAETK